MPRPIVQRPAVHRAEVGMSGGAATRLEGNGARTGMAPALRLAVWLTCALLWLSGVAWLVLHYAFPQQGPFGTLPNPWEPATMRVHGLIAVAGVFLLGWIAAMHVLARWGSGYRRASGLALAGGALVLLASGYALDYTTGTGHEAAALVHEWLGVAALVAGLAHWWGGRAGRGGLGTRFRS